MLSRDSLNSTLSFALHFYGYDILQVKKKWKQEVEGLKGKVEKKREIT